MRLVEQTGKYAAYLKLILRYVQIEMNKSVCKYSGDIPYIISP